MHASIAADRARHDGHTIGFTLGVIALVVALGGVGLAYVLTAMTRGAPEGGSVVQSGGIVTRTIGATSLTIPAAWLTGDDQAAGGFAKQVDFAVTLPLGPDGAARRIEVSLTQPSRVLPSASLLDGVYLHEFLPAQLSGPPGLIGKPLSGQEGYENETVWYDPINASPFVAKCAAPVTAGQPGNCLRAVYLGSGIAAIYSFADDLLPNWRKFDAQMHPLLNEIGAL
ncbi:MAG TPA: hypothetical protein VHZ56_07160 [Devosia sp.]|nr:hypothetical protein [Devosia sp.]